MKARYITLFVVILVIAGMIGYALSSGLSIHQWLVLATPLVAWILLGIWYAIWGWGHWKTRLKVSGSLFLVLLLVAGGIRYLTRYEGSTSGASLPKLVWKWSSREIEGIETRVNASAVDQTIEEESASVSTNFLGPDRNGMWKEVPFSLDWESNPPVELWRRPVGPAWSSFAVAGGKAITLEQVDDDEQVLCLDLLSGREIWRQVDTGVNFVKSKEGAAGALMGGKGPRSTPTIFGDRVYVMGSTGNAKCLQLKTGNLLWQRNVITGYEGLIPKWGKSNSPLILEDEGLVVVTGSETKGVSIIALDLTTGEPEWTYETDGASYSSPTILNLLGTRQIVSVNAVDVCGLDPATGKELWRHEWKRTDPKVCQPMQVSENRILVTASYGAGSPLIELEKDGEDWSTSEIWRSTRMKTKFSSAVILDLHAFGIDEGRLAAIDLANGNKAWKRQKYGFGQQLLVEDHLIIQTEPGDVVLGIPTPEQFTETYRLKALSSMTWNTPALAGRFLLVRNDREAICFLLPEKI